MIVVHRRLTWSHLGVGARGVEEVSDSDSELSSSPYEDFILVTNNNWLTLTLDQQKTVYSWVA